MQDPLAPAEFRMGSGDAFSHPINMSQPATAEELREASEDNLLHEILAMNTLAMQRCNANMPEEATTILTEAYMKLHNRTSPQNQQMIDTLRATTLNNLGVVECHRGQHRQALSHFEAARQLEETWGTASPSVALNSCAAYNALGMYDKATAAATETIDMLRTLAIQEKKNNTAGANTTGNTNTGTGGMGGDACRSLQGSGIIIAKSDNDALWGAAWHNMAVAQINTARVTKDPTEHANAAVLFQNAMRATQELLGRDHPMTKSVTATYRKVRDVIRSYGVYKQHHTMLTAPPRPVDPRDDEEEMEKYLQQSGAKSRRRALDKYHRDLTITFCGEATKGIKLTERLDPTPYPGALDEPFRKKKGKKMPRVLRGMALSETLLQAGQLYSNPHPLLFSLPPNYQTTMGGTLKDSQKRTEGNSGNGGMSGFRTITAPTKSTVKQSQQSQQQQRRRQPPPPPPPPQPQQQQQQPWQVDSTKRSGNLNYQQVAPAPLQQKNNVYQGSMSNNRQKNTNHKQAPPVYAQIHPNPKPSSPSHEQISSNYSYDPLTYETTSLSSQEAMYNYQKNTSNSQEGSSRNPQIHRQVSPNDQTKVMDHRGNNCEPQISSQKVMASEKADASSERIPAQHSYKTRHPRPPSSERILPPISKTTTRGGKVSGRRTPSGADCAVAAAAESARPTTASTKATASSAGRSRQRSPSVSKSTTIPAAGPTYEQIKYILLAEPQEERQKRWTVDQRSMNELSPPLAASNNALQTMNSELNAESVDGKTHQLFDAMWVTATPATDTAKTHTVGRPSYYVSSVVNLSKGDALLPEEVMQMMMEGSSTSVNETTTLNVESNH
ncbi:hypothetical protein LSM04_006146 [Trypanosoma melophagium]|uniref:uncharacterized protein n=1 Tax=Trypanosoma melophagium TaxID=715481 RepID=UPI00351AA6EA|nr:hypothetical protein LSM04_006146 [Trypanosoma melophagium]